jgi:putative nucleotidyltransferase with HDIG domain
VAWVAVDPAASMSCYHDRMIAARPRQARISARLAALFGLTQAVLLLAILFPLLPGRLRASVGDIATQTITAPRSFSYSSEVVRQGLQEQASKAVKDVIAFEVNTRGDQLRALDDELSSIDQARSLGFAPSGSATDLPRNERVSLPPTAIPAALAMPDDRWRATQAEARRVLGEILLEPFTTEEQPAKRASAPARIKEDFNPAERGVISALVQPLVVATERVDSAATESQRQKAIDAVPPQVRQFAQNQDIVRQGDPIDASDLEALRASGLLNARLSLPDLLAVLTVAVATASVLAAYLLICQPASLASYRRLLLLSIAVASVALMAKVYFPLVLQDSHRRFYVFAFPIALVPMLVAALFEFQAAILVAATGAALAGFTAIFVPQLAGYIGLSAVQLFQVLLAFLLASLAGVFCVRAADRFSRYLIAAGAVATGSLLGASAIWWLDAARHPVDIIWMAVASAVSGALASLLTFALVALAAPRLKSSTRRQLLELGQLNAPLLRRLQAEAPGTFQHSVLVGNLAEPAAYLVGGDALLVRVGCYYHDIGKLWRPGSFAENQLDGVGPHDRLGPQVSAQMIAEQVRYGEELARTHRLPDAVRAFIAEHHGTRLVTYYSMGSAQTDPDIHIAVFPYPGPLPRSLETAVVMLADSAETAVRTAAERTPERIDAVVEEVIRERLSAGQLDDSDLTLRALRIVAESFKLTLRALYHPPMEYPAPTPLEAARLRRAATAD